MRYYEKAIQLTLYVLDDSAVYWRVAVVFDFANDDFRVLTDAVGLATNKMGILPHHGP
jgi:hypothetical protein